MEGTIPKLNIQGVFFLTFLSKIARLPPKRWALLLWFLNVRQTVQHRHKTYEFRFQRLSQESEIHELEWSPRTWQSCRKSLKQCCSHWTVGTWLRRCDSAVWAAADHFLGSTSACNKHKVKSWTRRCRGGGRWGDEGIQTGDASHRISFHKLYFRC